MASIPADIVQRVRVAAGNRCGYCLTPQRLYMGKLEIEHILHALKAARMTKQIYGYHAAFAMHTKVRQSIPKRVKLSR